jgi:hypothetical protein
MKRSLLFAVTAVLATLGAAPSDALTVDFSFTNVTGTIPGTVTGEIFLPSSANGIYAATQVWIDSAPAAISLSPGVPPFDILALPGVVTQGFDNKFTVSNGNITNASFGAHWDQNGIWMWELYMDTGGSGYSLYGNPRDNVVASGESISFTVSAVPEPSTWILMLAGLTVLGFAARRQKKQNAALATA